MPADLNGLLSTAKNLPELNKGFAIRLLHISRADGYVATTLMCRHDGSGMAIEGLKEKQ